MRRFAGGLAATMVAAMSISASANAGVINVELYTNQELETSTFGSPGSASYYDQGTETNNLLLTLRDGSATFTERSGVLVLPEIVNLRLDLFNPVRFVQVCTLGLTTSTCKIASGPRGGFASADGGNGNDRLEAASSATNVNLSLNGGTGNDSVLGSPRDDFLSGGPGNDTVDGGGGADTIENLGFLAPNGNDVFRGGPGDDNIMAFDGNADQVFCGDGNDAVNADDLDTVAPDCENVI